MSHDYHEGQPNYSPAQLLKDGCEECSQRSSRPWVAINNLDPATFARAWVRAADFERGQLDDVSLAEVPLLRILWAIQIQLEQRGIPIGTVPGSPFGALDDEIAQAFSAAQEATR